MKGKHFKRFCWTTRKIISAILSGALLLAMIGFASFAWLTSKHEPVVNEFTGSKLEITLTPGGSKGPYQLLPGVKYVLSEDDDSEVTIENGSVDCYLFVVIEETNCITTADANGATRSYYTTVINDAPWDYTTLYQQSTDSSGNIVDKTVLFFKGCYSKVDETANAKVYYNNTAGNIVAEGGTDYAGDLADGKIWPAGVIPSSGSNRTFDIISSFQINEDLRKTDVHPDRFQNGYKLPQVKVTAYTIQTLGFQGQSTEGSELERAVNDIELAWEVVADAIENNNTKEVVLE